MAGLDKTAEAQEDQDSTVVDGAQDTGEGDAESEVAGEPESPDGSADADQPAPPAEDEVVVSIGEEEPPSQESTAPSPGLVGQLRREIRDRNKRVRELEGQLAGREPKAPELGKKPSLEDCDYDTAKYDAAMQAYYERKRAADELEAKARQAQEAEQRAHQDKLAEYGKARGSLGVSDFDDAEAVVLETLSATQQSIVLHGCENPAAVVYALGRYPEKAKELAKLADPVKFAFAVAKLEGQVKLTKRNAPPPPEKQVRSDARISGTVDATLERLRKEADRSGDRSKVAAYIRQHRQ